MIRLVEREPLSLSIDAAKDAANNAYGRARAAQRALVANLRLIELMYRPGMVRRSRLVGEHAEALRQVARAQAVADALADAIEALDAAERRP
jgi:hypothetical protein